MIARRICIALFFNQGKIYKNILGRNYPRVDVYSHFRNKFFSDFIEENQDKDDSEFKGKSLEEYALSKMVNASTGLLNTTLCLDVEELAAKGAMLPRREIGLKVKVSLLTCSMKNMRKKNRTKTILLKKNHQLKTLRH